MELERRCEVGTTGVFVERSLSTARAYMKRSLADRVLTNAPVLDDGWLFSGPVDPQLVGRGLPRCFETLDLLADADAEPSEEPMRDRSVGGERVLAIEVGA